MAIVTCFDCGNPISVNAGMCPHCGTSNTPMNQRIYDENLQYETEMLLAESAAQEQAATITLYLIGAYCLGVLLFLWFCIWLLNS
jgi:predicted ATP-dependent serine protease|tara:strand:+ start:453 stop:707 length:255 start_codon:yes stop_codon:yes gene_type:complete